MANWSPAQNEMAIADFFGSKGLNLSQISGILGNIEQESGFNPEAVQQGGPGRGILQWSAGGRWQPNLMTGNDSTDLMNQLNYAWGELTSNPSYGLSQLEQATNPQQAAQIFGTMDERYGVAGNRLQDASQIDQWLQNSGFNPNPSADQQALNSAFGGDVNALLAGANVSNQALSQQGVLGQAQQSITDQQLLAQLQDTLKALGLSGESLGIQKQGLYEQGAYLKSQGGLQKEQDLLQKLQATEGWQNLQQQLGLQTTEAKQGYQQGLHNLTSGNAASGVLNSGSTGYGKGVLGEQLQNTMKGIGIERTQGSEAYQNALKQIGLEWQGQNLSFGYQSEQLQNALKQLGIQQQQLGLQGTEARQQYQFGTQGAANQYADLLNSILMQQGQSMMGLGGNIGQLLQELLGAGSFSGVG